MNEKINIAEILKDCPKGTKLYSPLCGECRLIKIYDSLGFDVINGTNDVFNFSYDGRYNLNGECCIFPSKEQRDWCKFQIPFKDGDIIYVKSKSVSNIELVAIYEKENNERIYDYCSVPLGSKSFYHYNVYGLISKNNIDISRLATEEEKIKLFQAIKDNGYKWNKETKTLETLVEPTFKVGDRIRHKDSGICCTLGEYSEGISAYRTNIGGLSITHKDMEQWELCQLPNKFDITTLKPFESRVLVRDYYHECWRVSFFGHFDKFMGKFDTVRGVYIQCIPYEGNEHLLNTSNDCEEFYKTW